MNKEIEKLISDIRPAYADAVQLAKKRQEKLVKPPGSLGLLEDISIKYAGITGKVKNYPEKCRVLVMCADNGIIEEGVSSAPRSVTKAQAVNMTRRLTGMSSMAKYFGDEVVVADLGIADEYDCPSILNYKISRGTKNFLKEDAMSREDAEKSLLIGAELVRQAEHDGVDVIGIGEMGIGNTSTSTAVLCTLTGIDVRTATGRGGGLTDEAFEHKRQILEEALKRRQPDPSDVIGTIAKVGGLDIAAMCGAFLGAAECRIPVVIDGFISVVAALCAARLCPAAVDFMFPSHVSAEPGYLTAVEALGLTPWLSLGMRLGEGSGCVVAFRVIEAACAEMNNMALFGEESVIDDSYLDEIREKGGFGEEKK